MLPEAEADAKPEPLGVARTFGVGIAVSGPAWSLPGVDSLLPDLVGSLDAGVAEGAGIDEEEEEAEGSFDSPMLSVPNGNETFLSKVGAYTSDVILFIPSYSYGIGRIIF